jgi:hypothetical protein
LYYNNSKVNNNTRQAAVETTQHMAGQRLGAAQKVSQGKGEEGLTRRSVLTAIGPATRRRVELQVDEM